MTKLPRHQPTHEGRRPTQFYALFATPDARIWATLMGTTAMWALYLVTVYGLTSLICHWAWFTGPTPGLGLKLTQTLITLIATGVIASGGYIVYKEWRRARAAAITEADETLVGRVPLLAFVTLLLNGLYLLTMIFSLLAIMVLPVC